MNGEIPYIGIGRSFAHLAENKGASTKARSTGGLIGVAGFPLCNPSLSILKDSGDRALCFVPEFGEFGLGTALAITSTR